ncbi:ytbE [Symbiodinium natans]|uniref:YtbE protein n=1 Tax=Symbiodinium natans TaxID=878477 RepID=A0A812ND50_9DINO|nr:ytbE [Symbiodinium natans]
MRERGLARAVGVCNFSAGHMSRLAATGRELPEVLQVELHLAQQQRELAAYCAGNGIRVMAASPLARGQLCRATGKLPALQDLAGVATKKSRSLAEVAVRWCLQQGFIALPKSKVQGHLEANAAFGFELTAPDMSALQCLDSRFSVTSSAQCLEFPWEQAVAEHSEVSDGDVGEERPRRRRRRRRKGKGKGKGKGGQEGKGGSRAPTSGTAAQRDVWLLQRHEPVGARQSLSNLSTMQQSGFESCRVLQCATAIATRSSWPSLEGIR